MGSNVGGGPPSLFMFFFIAIGLIIVGFIIFNVAKGVSAWSQNNASPLLTREAVVVAKRSEVSGGSGDSSASTWYYATFEFADGSRLELAVRGNVYGLLAEGDRGTLQSQGTRYVDFRRAEI